MKKIYLLAAAVTFAFTANAQFTDDMESYTTGQMGAQNTAVWSVWSGTPAGPSAEDITVSTTFAQSGTQSGFIDNGQGPQDALLLLGNKTSGIWTVKFSAYIPTGGSGYFNVQGETENGGAGNGGGGVFNSGNIQFANDGTASDDNGGATFTYPQDAWFDVTVEADVDATTYVLTIDGQSAAPALFGDDSTLGALDLFANEPDNQMYHDDFVFISGVFGTDDFDAANFSVYPNPVKDVLNISSKNTVDSVVVYDVLGKVVLQSTPGVISPSIDTSSLSSGAYLVNVTIDGSSKTIKVIK